MKFEIIEDKEQLYDKCENMEQLYDNYYYNLLVNYQELKKQLSNSHQIKKQNEEYKRLGFKHLNDKCNELETQLSIKTLQLEEMKLSKRDYTQENILEMKLTLKENQQKEFIDYLESKIDRLARECSHIYENSLGKTRLVNEDIFNEVDKILSKYKEIIGENNE